MPAKFQDLSVRGVPTRDWENVRGNGLRKTAFYKFNSTYGSSGYIHMKTNIPNTNRAWYMIEAVGYNYGLSMDIYTMWGFKPQQISNNVKKSVNPRTEGLDAANTSLQGIYLSSDNFTVIYAFASSFYYIGFCLNLFAATELEAEDNSYVIPDVLITAASLNQTSGQYY